MRQRVGFARALVLEPDLLLMDEPFSALDVLTAENLRTELMALWAGESFPTQAICLVTHNIEEAVLLADRVIVLGANPGHISAELPIELQRPRDRRSAAFESLVDKLYELLTGVEPGVTIPEPAEATPTTRPLPNASVGGLAGLVEIVYARGGRADLPDIADRTQLRDRRPTAPGRRRCAARPGSRLARGPRTHFHRNRIHHRRHPDQQADLRPASAARAPLVRTICKALGASADGNLRAEFFLDLLRRGFGTDEAQQQLDTAIAWGRYGELFDYDTDSDQITADPAAAFVTPPNN